MDVERTTLQPRTVLGVHEVVPMLDLPAFFGRALQRAGDVLHESGLAPVGQPVAVYEGDPSSTVDVTAGFPVDEGVVAPEGTLVMALPGGAAVTAVHHGGYDGMAETYEELRKWMERERISPAA